MRMTWKSSARVLSATETGTKRQLYICGACDALAETMHKCGRCKRVAYCSESCQSADWSRHKRECKESSEECELRRVIKIERLPETCEDLMTKRVNTELIARFSLGEAERGIDSYGFVARCNLILDGKSLGDDFLTGTLGNRNAAIKLGAWIFVQEEEAEVPIIRVTALLADASFDFGTLEKNETLVLWALTNVLHILQPDREPLSREKAQKYTVQMRSTRRLYEFVNQLTTQLGK